MLGTKPFLLAVTLLFSSATAFGQSTPIESHEYWSKGGIGILIKGVYVDTKSPRNEVVIPEGKRWSGMNRSSLQVVYVINGKVIEHPSKEVTFDLAKAILISFQKDRIYFYDFPHSAGGYYLRSSD